MILLAVTPVGLAVAHWTGIISWDDYPAVLVVFLLYNLVFFLPAFYLHITYYVCNCKTLLTVDSTSKRFTISDNNGTFDFSLDDIQLTEHNLGIYYKNKIDHHWRMTAPWTGYGYLKLKLKSGQIFFLSSLMLDVKNPPFPISQTRYRFLQVIDRREVRLADLRKWIEQERQHKYNNYLEQFADLPKEMLQAKVDNFELYEPEAVAASKKLMELSAAKTNPDG